MEKIGVAIMAAAPQTEHLPEPVSVVHVQNEFRCDPPQHFFHREHILTVFVKGKGLYRNGAIELPLDRPLISLLPAGEEDVNGLVGPAEGWYVNFHWRGVNFTHTQKREFQFAAFCKTITVPRYKRLSGADLARITQQYGKLRAAFARQDVSGVIQSRALLLDLLAMYLDLPDDAGEFAGHRALAQFCELLQKRACDDVTIEQLSDDAGISADHLRDLFRARFGMRPVEYRSGLRLAKARELLAATTLNVKEVAHAVGYPDALYFSRVFKAQFGIAPRDVIRRYRMPSGLQ